jgi:hypothetical protein
MTFKSGSHGTSNSNICPLVTLHDVAYLGGYVPVTGIWPGYSYDIPFLEDRLQVLTRRHAQVLAELPYSEIEDVEIGGPGLVKGGDGFIGGGLGVTNAIEGMAIAGVLNGLTSRTVIKTIVRIQGTNCELFLLHTRVPPEELRIALSRPFAAIRSAHASHDTRKVEHEAPSRPAPPIEELAKLADMLEKGLLTRGEFDAMKAKLLGLQS